MRLLDPEDAWVNWKKARISHLTLTLQKRELVAKGLD